MPQEEIDLDEEQELWRRWREAADAAAREGLLGRYARYARIIAATCFSRRLHNGIEFADYEQFAQVGMMEAFERYDPNRGARFKTFASRRIHGAILDGVERMSEIQQQIAAHKRLRDERGASIVEHAQAPGTRAPQQVMDYIAEVGMGLALAWILDGTGMVETPEASITQPFYRNAEIAQLRAHLLACVKSLPEQQTRVITSHYLQGIPFEQIAATMGLTKGRISQIHKQAIQALRGKLAPPECATAL